MNSGQPTTSLPPLPPEPLSQDAPGSCPEATIKRPSRQAEIWATVSALVVLALVTMLVAYTNQAMLERSRVIPNRFDFEARSALSRAIPLAVRVEWDVTDVTHSDETARPEILLDRHVVPTKQSPIEPFFVVPAHASWVGESHRMEVRIPPTTSPGNHTGTLRFRPIDGSGESAFPLSIEVPSFLEQWRPLLVWSVTAIFALVLIYSLLLNTFPAGKGAVVVRIFPSTSAPSDRRIPLGPTLSGWAAPWSRSTIDVDALLRVEGERGAAHLLEGVRFEFMRMALFDPVFPCVSIERAARFWKLPPGSYPHDPTLFSQGRRAPSQEIVYERDIEEWYVSIAGPEAVSDVRAIAFRWERA